MKRVLLTSPAAKVSVPFWGSKSLPLLAEAPCVAYWTVTGTAEASERVTVKAATPPSQTSGLEILRVAGTQRSSSASTVRREEAGRGRAPCPGRTAGACECRRANKED